MNADAHQNEQGPPSTPTTPAPRDITDHATNPANEALRVRAHDGPGPGGASHEYSIAIPVTTANTHGYQVFHLSFQNGPVQPNGDGVNGITQETLIAICIDRLRGFQNGPFPCRENALALTKLEEALHWLQTRTRTRIARGVEGTCQL